MFTRKETVLSFTSLVRLYRHVNEFVAVTELWSGTRKQSTYQC